MFKRSSIVLPKPEASVNCRSFCKTLKIRGASCLRNENFGQFSKFLKFKNLRKNVLNAPRVGLSWQNYEHFV